MNRKSLFKRRWDSVTNSWKYNKNFYETTILSKLSLNGDGTNLYIPTSTLNKNSIVLDFGANIGTFIIHMHKSYGCRVIAYEPTPRLFEILKNRFDKFEII